MSIRLSEMRRYLDRDDARSLFLSDRRRPEFFGGTELSCLQAYFLEQGVIVAHHASLFVLESLVKPNLHLSVVGYLIAVDGASGV